MNTRAVQIGALVACAYAGSGTAVGQRVTNELVTRVRIDREADVIVSLACDDELRVDGAHQAHAFTITVDGQPVEELLLFPGSGRRQYDAIVGPLAAGAHDIALVPSRLWPGPTSGVHDLRARIVKPEDRDAAVIAHAPALWARADTIGTANDLPLLMYAETTGDANGATNLTYSMIFSNEDGGTATRALMARWGRATDIEWLYSATLDHGAVTSETFQGPSHETRAFSGQRAGPHPVLLVATMNNVFSDRGVGVALVRPVPVMVDLSSATRESVMDREPWTYVVMGHELRAEHKIADAGDAGQGTIADPRRFVYVEARLELRGATVAAHARDAGGVWHASDRGAADLRVDRDGWVRVAVGVGTAAPTAIGWSCEAKATSGSARADAPSCRVSATRAFRLGDRYEVGPNLIQPASLTLAAGEMRTLDLATTVGLNGR